MKSEMERRINDLELAMLRHFGTMRALVARLEAAGGGDEGLGEVAVRGGASQDGGAEGAANVGRHGFQGFSQGFEVVHPTCRYCKCAVKGRVHDGTPRGAA